MGVAFQPYRYAADSFPDINQCFTCQTDFQEGQLVIGHDKHIGCEPCQRNWLAAKDAEGGISTCPICRTPILNARDYLPRQGVIKQVITGVAFGAIHMLGSAVFDHLEKTVEQTAGAPLSDPMAPFRCFPTLFGTTYFILAPLIVRRQTLFSKGFWGGMGAMATTTAMAVGKIGSWLQFCLAIQSVMGGFCFLKNRMSRS